MKHSQFERLVRNAMELLPKEISSRLDNVDVTVEDLPTQEQLAGHILDETDVLLGIYDGVPLTERADYGMVLPDKITIFQQSIEAICSTEDEIIEEVCQTVVHEVAHHFGIDDGKLTELEQ